MWPFDKFNNRLYMIRDLINEFFESNKLPKLAKEEDPFWDPPEPILIGTAYLKLESLGVMFDNKLEASIVGNERGGQCGRIAVSYVPTDETGEAGEAPEELQVEDASELVGQRIDFNVCIDEIIGLPKDLCTDVFVQYKIFLDDTNYMTEICKGADQDPKVGYKSHHTVDFITEAFVKYLKEDNVSFY